MLYTRKGDQGTTKLFGCDQRMSKSSTIAEALGTVDELNAYLGLCRSELGDHQSYELPRVGRKRDTLSAIFLGVQETLFVIQAELAGAPGKMVRAARVTKLEQYIDTLEQAMPPITSFLIPGGSVVSAQCDVARTLVRRAERRVVAVHEEGLARVGKHTRAYLNRLSSLMYALARYTNHAAGVLDVPPSYR